MIQNSACNGKRHFGYNKIRLNNFCEIKANLLFHLLQILCLIPVYCRPMQKMSKYYLPLAVFLFVTFILSMMELKMETSMLMINRFIPGAGWIQIALLASYGAFLVYKMQDADKSAVWRKWSWLLFSLVFFTQFALGILADERFLMTDKLHLPVPFMIAAGPVYRAQMTIMPILLLSSILISGPAWCSHYCYFGAWDGLMASSKAKKSSGKLRLNDRNKEKEKEKEKEGIRSEGELHRGEPVRQKWAWKMTFFVLIILFAWVFRMFNLKGLQTLIPALVLAGFSIGIMIFISRKRQKMVHCVAFCPIGTLVNIGKYISPFRMKIESSCTSCMRCIPTCPYDALNVKDIKAGKPGITCTLCGDCVSSCDVSAIQYRFFRMSPKAARNLYLVVTISVHVLCMGLARL